MNLGSSVISKSHSDMMISEESNNLIEGKSSIVDCFFPVINEITKNVKLPRFFYSIAFIFFAFQVMVTSKWYRVSNCDESTSCVYVVPSLEQIAFFTSANSSVSSILNQLYVHLIIFSVLIVLVLYQLIHFNRARRFVRWTLYPTLFMAEIATLLEMHPLAFLIMRCHFLGDLGQFESIFVVVLGIMFVIELIIFVYFHQLINISAFISTNPFSSFDSFPFIIMICTSPPLLFIDQYFQRFPEWAHYIVIVSHIIGMIFIIYRMRYFPFLVHFSNVFIISVAVGSIALDIVSIIKKSLLNDSTISFIILLTIVLLLSIIITYFLFLRSMNNVKQNLTIKHKEGETKSDFNKSERFQDIGLDLNEELSRFYLHYGLEYMLELFIDFSSLKFSLNYWKSTDMLVYCARIVNFFPCEVRLCNLLFSTLITRRDLSYQHRFLMFQINKVKILRQSSSSRASAERLSEMKQNTLQESNRISSFWKRDQGITVSELYSYYKSVSFDRSLWEETIQDYPNSAPYYEEYSRFLIECVTDFSKAIIAKSRETLVDNGANLSIDVCFHLFIRAYPFYLKQKVLDTKGFFIKPDSVPKKRETSQSSFLSIGSSTDIDPRKEEEIGKSIITQSKLRLALQRATEGRKANYSRRLFVFTFLGTLVTVLLLSFYYYALIQVFENRRDGTKRSTLISDIRFYFASSNLLLLMEWGLNVVPNRLVFDQSFVDLLSFNCSNDYLVLDVDNPFLYNAGLFNLQARDRYDSFLSEASNMALNDIDLFTKLPAFSGNVSVYYCKNGSPGSPISTSIRTTTTYFLLIQSLLVGGGSKNASYWLSEDPNMCSALKTRSSFYSILSQLESNLTAHQDEIAAETKQSLTGYQWTVPIIFFFVFVLPFFVMLGFLIRELSTFTNLILRLDASAKEEASKPIRKGIKPDEKSGNTLKQTSGSNSRLIITIIILVILILGISSIMSIMVYVAYTMNSQYNYVARWAFYNNPRIGMIADAVYSLFASIVLSNSSLSSDYINYNDEIARIAPLTAELEENREMLLNDQDGHVSILGHDDWLDDYILKERCTPSVVNTTLHDMYYCASLNQLHTFFTNMLAEARTNIKYFEGKIQGELVFNILHIAFHHFIPDINVVNQRLNNIIDSFEQEYTIIIVLLYAIGIIFVIGAFFMSQSFLSMIDSSYQSALMILRRAPPISVACNHDLIDYLMNQNNTIKNRFESTSSSIIRNASDAVFFTGMTGIIEHVNRGATQILGYTPEQILGQDISVIFVERERDNIRNQIHLMMNKQSSANFEDHVTCMSDNEAEIPCNLIILGMKQENKDSIDSFVIILRNEIELIEQQEKAQQAKKKSEDLLYQILPRDIVVRLNEGEKDISFSVPSATVMFIDIVKFSEYSALLSPQEIMGNLSIIFSAFDNLLTKYPLLTKIKLIGDVYMCAGGLFNPNSPPAQHAEQMTRFAIEAIQQLEEINVKLNANLNVRIGINTGGPLIAGVLGTDKPVFDIIGDTINVASRLQSTSIAGKIQITHATYELIQNFEFEIETRGEVFLKGKGKTQTYLVSPPGGTFAFSGISTIPSRSFDHGD